MSQKNFEAVYFASDFVGLPTPSTPINLDVLKDAVALVMLTDHNLEKIGFNTVRLTASPTPPESEVLAVDAAVAAHTGVATVDRGDFLTSSIATSALDSTDVQFLSLTTPPLAKGDWLFGLSCDHGMLAVVANARSRVTFRVNGTNRGRDFNPTADSISAPQLRFERVQAGEIYTLTAEIARVGGASGTATVATSARIWFTPTYLVV